MCQLSLKSVLLIIIIIIKDFCIASVTNKDLLTNALFIVVLLVWIVLSEEMSF